MTFAQLSDECWRDLPPVRRWLAGRPAVDKLLADAVLELEPARLAACITDAECSGYQGRLLARVKRRNETVGEGFAIAIFLLTVIAAAVISWLVQRWLDHHFPEGQLEQWRQEITT